MTLRGPQAERERGEGLWRVRSRTTGRAIRMLGRMPDWTVAPIVAQTRRLPASLPCHRFRPVEPTTRPETETAQRMLPAAPTRRSILAPTTVACWSHAPRGAALRSSTHSRASSALARACRQPGGCRNRPSSAPSTRCGCVRPRWTATRWSGPALSRLRPVVWPAMRTSSSAACARTPASTSRLSTARPRPNLPCRAAPR